MAEYRFNICLDPVCGKRFKVPLTGRTKTYCSDRCKQRGYRRRAKIRGASEESVTKLPPNPLTFRNGPSQAIDNKGPFGAQNGTLGGNLTVAYYWPPEPEKLLYRDRWGFIHRHPVGSRRPIPSDSASLYERRPFGPGVDLEGWNKWRPAA